MDRWLILAMVIAGGFAALTFLRIVGHEILIKNREIDATAEKAREEIKKRLATAEHERIEEALLAKRAEKANA
jgi:hypothetical protein